MKYILLIVKLHNGDIQVMVTCVELKIQEDSLSFWRIRGWRIFFTIVAKSFSRVLQWWRVNLWLAQEWRNFILPYFEKLELKSSVKG